MCYSYVIVVDKGQSTKPVTVYRGIVERFLNVMMWKKELRKKLLKIKPMNFLEDEEIAFKEVTTWSICDNLLELDSAWHHKYMIGECRGVSSIGCKNHFEQSKTISVVFHNHRYYEAHWLMIKLKNTVITTQTSLLYIGNTILLKFEDIPALSWWFSWAVSSSFPSLVEISG